MIANITLAHQRVPVALTHILAEAELAWNKNQSISPLVSQKFLNALDYISQKSEQSSTAFTNVITGLAIKVAFPKIDIRYHQEQIQGKTRSGAGFSFRTVSEDDVYPWLQEQKFDGAKSGWQTRTYERDDPYDLKYPHKIGGQNTTLKSNFLRIYDRVETKGESAQEALRYLLFRQVEKRHTQTIDFVIPRTKNIDLIVDIFERHFFHQYGTKGASRLPVLALHALYSIIIPETERLSDKSLKPLEAHVAADVRTGALGDVEVSNEDGTIFEAVEVKHNLKISTSVLTTAQDKIGKSGGHVRRYYILTTHSENTSSSDQQKLIQKIEELYDCVVIINGVQSTIRYYLRLVSDPSAIFAPYVELIGSDPALSHDHRTAWNTVVSLA